MIIYGGVDCTDPGIPDLRTSWMPQPLYPYGKSPCTHWTGGWFDPRTSLDNVERREIVPLLGFELHPLSCPAHCQLLY